jgi:hypothetical protein
MLFMLGFYLNGISATKEIISLAFQKEKTLEFPVDNPEYRQIYSFAEDNRSGQELFISVNQFYYSQSYKIQIYDLKTQKLVKNIDSPENFIPGTACYLNSDSIYVTQYKGDRLLLIDTSGKIKNQWKIQESDGSEMAFGSTEGIKVNSKSIIASSFCFKGDFRDGSYYNYPNLYCYDKFSNSGKLNIQNRIPFSEVFKKGIEWYEMGLSFALKDEQLYVSYAVDHSIYCYDESGMKTIPAKSKYIDKFLPFDIKRINSMPYIDSMYRIIPQYTGLYYDKYRHLFYRAAVRQTPISYDGENITEMKDKLFSIICMDENFKIIDEIEMPRSKYWSSMYICKDGLLFEYCDTPTGKILLDLFKVNIKYKD